MTKKPAEAQPEAPAQPLPSGGGTYVWTPDGGLVAVEAPQPDHDDTSVKED